MTTVDMIDITHSSLDRLPHRLARSIGKIAGYTTGSPDIQWNSRDWNVLPHIGKVRIDQSDSNFPGNGDVKDCESGAATIDTAVEWAVRRKEMGKPATIYIQQSGLEECESKCKAAGVSPYYWLADWNLDRESAASQLGGRIVAIQWASPSSNPHTLVPGTRLTLAEVNCDLSVALENWLPGPKRKMSIFHRHTNSHSKPIHHKVIGSTGGGGLGTGLVTILAAVGVHLTATEAAAIAAAMAMIVGYLTPSKGDQ